MRLQPIVDQLAAIPQFVTLGGALEFAALKQLPGRLPAAYAIAAAESAALSSRATAVIDQKVTGLFDVMLILGAARGGGEKVSEDLHELEQAVKNALVGWQHPDATSPTQFVSAQMASVDGTALTWGMRFTTSHHIRKVA